MCKAHSRVTVTKTAGVIGEKDTVQTTEMTGVELDGSDLNVFESN